MPKVLQLNVTANWGSTGKIAEGIGIVALNRGWESAIAYGRLMNPSQLKLTKVGNKIDVYLHYARYRFLDEEGLGSKRATKRFIRQIKDYNPDIIHLHNIHDHWLNYPILFEYLASIDTPVVWTFHDCWAFTGGCAHFENAGCYKWKTAECRGECSQKRGWLLNRNKRNYKLKFCFISALKERLTIVGVSNWITDYAKQSFLNGSRFATIYNGIDLNIFKPSQTCKRRMILGVSNVWPAYKGLADFIRLRDVLPQDIEICIVGLTEEQIKTLPEGITGMTRTQGVDELVNLYCSASVFVNPTYNDTFPTVNLEALACGTPVVTYQTGGSPEAVDEKTGMVVEKGNVEEMAKSIMYVLGNPDKFSSGNCRRRAEICFNKNVQFNEYIDLYESLLAK